MAATAEYLASHPFASPDIVNPPEAPTYRYRPDLTSLVDLAGVETVDLSAGSRIDIIIEQKLQSYVLQSGIPTGSELEVIPDDYDVVLNQQYWLLVAAATSSFGGVLSFEDISGTISLDQLPPDSVVTVDSIGEDALYFFTDSTGLPSLVSADEVANFLSGHLSFSDLGGTISIDQFPDGSVATVESIDEDALYFFNNDSFVPELISKLDALIFLLPDQTGQDGFFLQTNAGVLSWAEATGGGGGSIASTNSFLLGDGAGAAVASDLTKLSNDVIQLSANANNAAGFLASNDSSGVNAYTFIQASSDTSFIDIEALSTTSTLYDPSIAEPGDVGIFAGGTKLYITNLGPIVFSNDQLATESIRIANGLSVGSTTDPGTGNILLAGLTASRFVETDINKVLVSKTASEMRTDLALVIGTNVQAWDADLDTWATKTPYAGTLTITTGKTFDVTNNLTLSGTDGSTLAIGTGGTLGTAAYTATGAYQPIDSDLTTIAGLTATTDNFIVSVSSAWASRTPTQVKTTLGLTIGTNVQAWDADLDTWATVTPASGIATFLATPSSANLRAALTDENGTGAALFSGCTSPTFVTPILGVPTSGTLTNCTGLPLTGLVASTSLAITVGSIELGDASDTTLTRSVTGHLLVEGVTVGVATDTLGFFAASTSTTIGIGHIELGHATDTTIERSGAGAITVEGVQVILSGAALGTPASGTLTSCTGLPIAGLTASTSTALGVGSIELGHASDTSLARVSAGVASIEGSNIIMASNLASNVLTFLGTPSSANLRAAMTDENGTGTCLFDGATLAALLTTATCGSSLASINIPAGTVPTTPNDGDIFADANCLYGCTDAGNPGVIPVVHFIRADGTVTYANDTNPHAVFTTPTNGRLTLETGTYMFQLHMVFTSMSATSGNLKLDVLGAGTATTGAWLWMSWGADAGLNLTNAAGTSTGNATSASPASIVTAATNTNVYFSSWGTFEVTGGGTLIPTITQVTAAASVLSIGSYFMCYRVGSSSVTSVGQWD